MKTYEKEVIESAFNRCWGLQSALKDGIEKNDALLSKGAIEALSNQTGLRKEFIEGNLKEIIEL